MDRKKRSKRLRNTFLCEAIVLLVCINAVLVIRLDKTVGAGAKVQSTIQKENVKEVLAENDTVTVENEEAKKAAATIDDDFLILVNGEHMVPDTYTVEKSTYKDTGKEVATAIVDPLTSMLEAGEKKGLSFSICSAYRSKEYQQKLIDKDVAKYMQEGMTYTEAYDKTIQSVQPAGYSEHATGLAVDIVSSSNSKLNESQEKTKEFKWLKKNCYKYGFILRYPDDKTEITGIIYEPWHFRYVGVEVATYITEAGITFEEYVEMISEE